MFRVSYHMPVAREAAGTLDRRACGPAAGPGHWQARDHAVCHGARSAVGNGVGIRQSRDSRRVAWHCREAAADSDNMKITTHATSPDLARVLKPALPGQAAAAAVTCPADRCPSQLGPSWLWLAGPFGKRGGDSVRPQSSRENKSIR